MMSKVKFVLIKIEEEDLHIMDYIPEELIIEEKVIPKDMVDECGHPVIYNP